jgi:hypothetical protein
MIQLVPTVSTNNFERTENEWKVIKDFLEYLNNQDEEPLLFDDDFIDMDIFDCFSLSSKKATYLSDLILESFYNGELEEYIKIFDQNYDYLYSFPTHDMLEFQKFSRYSDGFYCKRILTPYLL